MFSDGFKRLRRSLEGAGHPRMRVLKQGRAARIVFFYPGEEGTYIDDAWVRVYENGIVHIESRFEETMAHLQNCEVLWHIEPEATQGGNVVRLLKSRSTDPNSRPPTPPSPPTN